MANPLLPEKSPALNKVEQFIAAAKERMEKDLTERNEKTRLDLLKFEKFLADNERGRKESFARFDEAREARIKKGKAHDSTP